MDLIYVNSSMEDIGVIKAFNFDLAFGSDENNFELKVDINDHCCEAGYFVYIEGTEYGGIIDAIASDTESGEVTYSGRTWHGILNSKVICPDSGQDYLTLSGEANTVIGTLISRMGLSDIFIASSDTSSLTISSYKMVRYITGYDGIMKMLNAVKGKLVLSYHWSKVILSVVPVVDYTEATVIDSDILSFTIKKTSKKVNHLICLGKGELKNRTVVHLYADANGSISQTQTFTGLDEYTSVYDNSNAENTQKLIEAGSERLAELQKQDDLTVSLNEADDVFDIGDIVGAVDNVTGISISVPISKKIISIQNDFLSASYETEIGKVRTSTSGEGITADGGGTDYVVNQGTSNGWEYSLWNSGRAEMWRTFGTDKLACTTTWGSAYSGSWMNTAANKSGRRYPFAFVEVPIVIASPLVTAGNFWVASNQENDSGTDNDGYTMSKLTHAPAFQCVRGSSGTLTNPKISYYVIGKWK